MPSTDGKVELKAKTSVAQTNSQPCVYAKGLTEFKTHLCPHQIYSGDEIKEDQVGRAHGGEETVMQDVGRET
jgi:hypothetical protein